jgi:3'-phosphoadenosine 5'-phosphosulfate sulfotransferase (PAPS reductase)/FAD synthetase
MSVPDLINSIDRPALLERIGDCEVILSVSGGKDSTAAGLLLKELEIPFRCIHMATGWEHRETDRYVREKLPDILGPITILSAGIELEEDAEVLARTFCLRWGLGESAMVRLVIGRGGVFPSRTMRFCTSELKKAVAAAFFNDLDADPINVVGVRAQESKKRATYEEWEESEMVGGEVWRPLLHWSADDVKAMHARHGIKPNPLYLLGAQRVGCWPCVNASKADLRIMGTRDTQRVAMLKDLERLAKELTEARYALKGESLESKGFSAPAWFVNPNPRRWKVTESVEVPGEVDLFGNPRMEVRTRIVRQGNLVGIEEVIRWAMSDAAEDQVELFDDAGQSSCGGWGLCDMGAVAK